MQSGLVQKIILVLVWGLSVLVVATSPTVVPIHFGADGVANNFGSRYTLLILPALYTIIYFLFGMLGNNPQALNYPVKITPANQQQQYKLATQLLQMVLVSVGLVFVTIISSIYFINNATIVKLPSWLMIFILSIVFLPIGYYLFKAIKKR
jgi:hypothetical protein